MDKTPPVALITGGAGFIASHVIECLLAEGGWRITAIDNFDPFYDRAIKEANVAHLRGREDLRLIEADILDDDLGERIGDAPIDRLVHIAAKAGVRPSIQDPLGYHRVNVTGTLRMLELARARKVPHFILASSSSVGARFIAISGFDAGRIFP